jgi:hypothetical protein
MTILGKKDNINVLEVSRVLMPNTAYEAVVIELWLGDRSDLATSVDRYMLVYEPEKMGEHLYIEKSYSSWELATSENASQSWRRASQVPGVAVWTHIAEVKTADRDAMNHSSAEESMLNKEFRRYGYDGRRNEAFEAFLTAIDTLAENYEDEQAWAAVDGFRSIYAEQHEK